MSRNNSYIHCILCGRSEETPVTGVLSTKDFVTAHQNCLLYSSGIFCKNSPQFDDLFGFSVDDVKNEVKRGKRLRCDGCQNTGATAGCELKRCKKSYHYPCAVEWKAGVVEDDVSGTYRLYCPNHDPRTLENNNGVSNASSPLPGASPNVKEVKHKRSSSSRNTRGETSLQQVKSKRRIIDQSSESDGGNSAANSDHCAPIESDSDNTVASDPEQQDPQPTPIRNGHDMAGPSTSGNHPMQHDIAVGTEITTLDSDEKSPSLLSLGSSFVGIENGPRPAQVQAMPANSNPQSSHSPASFWESCNKAGCTRAIFSDFVAEMNDLSVRILSGQATREDYNVAMKVMEASGMLPDLVDKQKKEMKKRQEELQESLAAMNTVWSLLKR